MAYTQDDCLTTAILSSAVSKQNECAAAFKNVLNRDVAIAEIAAMLTQGTYTVPYPQLINVVENNLRALCDGGYHQDSVGGLVTWLGELDDAQRLSYQDVNRWFDSCDELTRIMSGASKRCAVTGRNYACSDRTRQILRRKG